jgi:myosin tail region-interacting protein MTI1
MAVPPFKVKASFPYDSAHSEDLNFPAGQIINITKVEDDDWYEGEYTDASGEYKTGLFPKNFVEKYEPAPPPRPVRSATNKSLSAPKQEQTKPPAPESESEEEDVALPTSPAVTAPVVQAPAPVPESKPQPAPKAVEQPVKTAPPAAAKSPPPVAEKPSSFKDRIAAFNRGSAAPIAPFKPAGLASTGFIKKPFVAPPPSRNAYVPPPREQVVAKVYRREEDPEIAERQAQDLENAEKAGLVPAGEEEAEEAPKTVSLKERIALLQKQQAEQAARQNNAAKEKPKKPPKKRVEDADEATSDAGEPAPRGSSDVDREHVEPRRVPRSVPQEPIVSGNEADLSAAGETETEASGQDEEVAHNAALHKEDEHKPEEEEEDEDEEDDVDDETRRSQALRARMAKLSGGIGMPGMFAPPGGMPMMGMASRSKPKKERQDFEEPTSPISAPRVPVIPMPGLQRMQTHDSAEDTAKPDDDGEDEPPIASPPLPVASKSKVERGMYSLTN